MTSPARRALVVGAALTPALALAGPAVASSPAPVASYRSCANVKDIGPTGMDPADAVSVRVKVASCGTARSVATKWAGAAVRQGGDTVTVGRYRCTQSYVGDRITVRCTARGGRVIRFKLG